MNCVICLVITSLFLTACAFGQTRLTYSHEGKLYSVDGFDFTRPYYEEGGEKNYLPLEGAWTLEIQDETFWDNCYFPKTYKLSKFLVTYREASHKLLK